MPTSNQITYFQGTMLELIHILVLFVCEISFPFILMWIADA